MCGKLWRRMKASREVRRSHLFANIALPLPERLASQRGVRNIIITLAAKVIAPAMPLISGIVSRKHVRHIVYFA